MGFGLRHAPEFEPANLYRAPRLNPVTFSGVMTSAFFGTPISAAAPRRVEIGARLTF